jgi:hypothetical protein
MVTWNSPINICNQIVNSFYGSFHILLSKIYSPQDTQFPAVRRQENCSFVPMKYRDVSRLVPKTFGMQFCAWAVHYIVFLFLSLSSKLSAVSFFYTDG